MNALDPLLQYRMGATLPLRLPDADTQPSAATVLRSEYTIGSDAAGHCVFSENTCLTAAKQTYVVTAGSTGAAVATAHPQSTAFNAEARAARMVAMRIQVLYIGAEQTSAGYLSFSEKTDTSDVQGQSVDALHTGSDVQIRATDGVVAYIDYTQTPRWEAPTASSFMYLTFPMAVFVASGLPVSTVSLFRVKVERFMEYLPVEGSLAEGELAHEPHNPGAIAAHGALSGASTSVAVPGKLNEFYKNVKDVANAAYHMAQPMLPYLVPQAREFLKKSALQAMPLLLTM